MSDDVVSVLEDQVDALAERIAVLEKRLTALIEILADPDVSNRLGLPPLKWHHVEPNNTSGLVARIQHENQRRDRVRAHEQRAATEREASERGELLRELVGRVERLESVEPGDQAGRSR